MHRSFKFLLRPTSRQVDALTAMVSDHRALYNAALEERRWAWKHNSLSIQFSTQAAQLKHIRAFDSDMRRWSATSQEQTLRRLQKTFEEFFRRLKLGQKAGYPRFKGSSNFDTVTFRQGDGGGWLPEQSRIRLQGVGQVRVHAHRSVRGVVKTLSIKREGRRWYVVLSCSDVPAEFEPSTGRITGIDLGVKSLLTTSEGVHVGNPEHGRVNAAKLAKAQQELSRCKQRSNRRKLVRARVAAHHRKVARQRVDYLRKVALTLVRDHDVIVHEKLRIGNMTRSAHGTVDEPGVNVAAKSGLNRSILDAGWGVFLSILTAKAESAGRELIAVDPRNTSRTCPSCGHVSGDNRVNQAEFRCQSCGHAAHADVNAAINILRAGLALRETENAA